MAPHCAVHYERCISTQPKKYLRPEFESDTSCPIHEGCRGMKENKINSLAILLSTTRSKQMSTPGLWELCTPRWSDDKAKCSVKQIWAISCSSYTIGQSHPTKLVEVSTQRNRYSGWVQTWFYKYICSVYFCFFAVLSTSAPYGWSILCLSEMIPHYAFMLLSSNTTHEKITRFA